MHFANAKCIFFHLALCVKVVQDEPSEPRLGLKFGLPEGPKMVSRGETSRHHERFESKKSIKIARNLIRRDIL